MNPEELAKKDTEHAHQVALCSFVNMAKNYGLEAAFDIRTYRDMVRAKSYDDTGIAELKWFHAIPNGGERNKAVASRLKAEGVTASVSDTFFPKPLNGYAGLYIEMKKPDGRLDKGQIEFLRDMQNNGYAAVCCRHWFHAARMLEAYIRGIEYFIPMDKYTQQYADLFNLTKKVITNVKF